MMMNIRFGATPIYTPPTRFGSAQSIQPLATTPITTGFDADTDEMQVIRSQTELEALWARFSQTNPSNQPGIDFNTQAAVFITAEALNANFNLDLTQAKWDPSQQQLTLTVQPRHSGRMGFGLQAETPVGVLAVFDKQYLQNTPAIIRA